LQDFYIPGDLPTIKSNPKTPGSIQLIDYSSTASALKVKITLQCNVFNLLLEGEKSVYFPGKQVRIDSTQMLLMSSGNCIMTERISPAGGRYKTILLFFEDAALINFFLKYPALKTATAVKQTDGFVIFQKDDFLYNYIRSLQLMIDADVNVSIEMKQLKFEELMMYLFHKYPSQMALFVHRKNDPEDILAFRKVVEANITNNITVEELAFLTNTSISTFKRKFSKIYGNTPNRWLLNKRMEMAAGLLLNNDEKPAEVYYKVGYENHSSFSQVFKQFFGMTPSDYKQQKLTFQQ